MSSVKLCDPVCSENEKTGSLLNWKKTPLCKTQVSAET